MQLKSDLEARYLAMDTALRNGSIYNPLEALRRRGEKDTRFTSRRLKLWDLLPHEPFVQADTKNESQTQESTDGELGSEQDKYQKRSFGKEENIFY